MDSASLLALFQKQTQSYNPIMESVYKTYLHAPPHYFVPNAMYMVTGSIVHKQPILQNDKHKEFFLQTLFEKATLFSWELEAWAVLHNHYHFIAQAPDNSTTLRKLLQQVHSITAIQFNRWNNASGRQVWQNYWDTCITYEKSYLARLRYVHENPVKHGFVDNAMDYPFCSYKWFIEKGDEELKERVFSQPIDKVNVFDSF